MLYTSIALADVRLAEAEYNEANRQHLAMSTAEVEPRYTAMSSDKAIANADRVHRAKQKFMDVMAGELGVLPLGKPENIQDAFEGEFIRHLKAFRVYLDTQRMSAASA